MTAGIQASALHKRYEADLQTLIDKGVELELAMICDYRPDLLEKKLTPEERKKLPSLNRDYQPWYSEALASIEKLLPNRVADFRSYYEPPKGRKIFDPATYRIADALNGLTKGTDAWGRGGVSQDAAIPHMQQQNAIVRSLKARLESSLFDIRSLLQADLFDGELDAARELLRKGFLRAAGAVAGVVLEGHLKQICADHKIPLPAKATISTANDKLRDAGVIDQAQWRFNQHLADIRNSCDHKEKGRVDAEPKQEHVLDLLNGTSKVIKTIF